jgi:hypothetical protein
MNTIQAFMQGKVAYEADGCTEVATAAVQDSIHLYGQGQFAIDTAPHGLLHFLCKFHKRDGYSFRKENDRLVRI